MCADGCVTDVLIGRATTLRTQLIGRRRPSRPISPLCAQDIPRFADSHQMGYGCAKPGIGRWRQVAALVVALLCLGAALVPVAEANSGTVGITVQHYAGAFSSQDAGSSTGATFSFSSSASPGFPATTQV